MDECENYILAYFKDLYETRGTGETRAFLEQAASIGKMLELYPGGKKIISYKEPPKKKGAVCNPAIPDIPAFTRYKNKTDSQNRIVLFNDENSIPFSFTKPIFEQTAEGMRRNYKTIKKGDSLYIWQNFDKSGPMHLTAHIITSEGVHYSVGFGFKGVRKFDHNIPLFKQSLDENFGQADGVLYTPDNVFEQKVRAQCTKKGTFVKLISATSITAEHLENMDGAFDLLDRIKTATLFFTTIDQSEGVDKDERREKLKEKLYAMIRYAMFNEEYNKDILGYIDFLSENKPFETIFNINYSLDYPVKYCRISGSKSGRAGKTYNCASFLHQVFADSIDCGIMSNFVISPDRCGPGSLPVKKCRPIRRKKPIDLD